MSISYLGFAAVLTFLLAGAASGGRVTKTFSLPVNALGFQTDLSVLLEIFL